MSAHTPGPLELAVMDPNKDPAEFTRDSLSHGSGPVWMVWAPQHPKTRGVHPSPEHAVITATTGNGPASEANARLYAAAPDLLAALMGVSEMCVDGFAGGALERHRCWCFEEDLFVCRNTPRCQSIQALVAKAEGKL